MTPPDEVFAFIDEMPGLANSCEWNPRMLAYYAPQLTIRGFSGPFESAFDEIREHMVEKQSDRVLSELQPMPLRADDFSTVGASHMASEFVDGDMHGPPVRHHEHDHADYLFWMLSSKSKWLPSAIRDMLVRGMAEWAVWRWHTATGYGRPLEDRGISGKLLRAMYEQEDPDWIPTGEARGDLLARSRIAIEDLGLPEAPEELADRMIEQRVIATFIEVESRRRAKG